MERQALGETRIPRAVQADVRVLLLLSDFAFFEGEPVLKGLGQRLSEHGAYPTGVATPVTSAARA